MKKLFISILFIIFCNVLVLKAQATIYGRVFDATTHEALIGTFVYTDTDGVSTDNTGFYSLKLSEKKKTKIYFSLVGYKLYSLELKTDRDTLLNIFLEAQQNQISETVIRADLRPKNIGQINIPLSKIQNQVSILAETDPIKAIQNIAGIGYANEGQTNSVIRGQDPSANYLIVDGVPIYNSNHALGLLSTINSETVKSINLYNSYLPAYYGGKSGGVIDVITKDGNTERVQANISLGLISAKGNVELPIVKGKTSLSISGRRSLIDLFIPLTTKNEKESSNFSFYDSNIKLVHKYNDRLTLSLSGILSGDRLWINRKENNLEQLAKKQEYKWGTYGGNFSVNYIASPIWNSQFQLISSNYYRRELVSNVTDLHNGNYTAEHLLRWDNKILPYNNLILRTGIGLISRFASINKTDKISFFDTYAYVDSKWDITKKLSTQFSLRLEYPFFNVLPRIGILMHLNPMLNIEGVYSKSSQRTLTASSNNSFLQVDTWFFPSKNIKPSTTNNYSLSVKGDLSNAISYKIATYYISMANIIDYREGYTRLSNYNKLTDKLSIGKGYSYGIEFQLTAKWKRLVGDVSYSYGQVRHLFKDINEGQWYRPYYDRPHKINISTSYVFNKHWDISLNWTYLSGNLQTMAFELVPFVIASSNTPPIKQISQKNNFRLPSYHRLDIGVNYRISHWTISASLYNAYNRANTYRAIMEEVNGVRTIKGMTLLPIIPGINIKYTY